MTRSRYNLRGFLELMGSVRLGVYLLTVVVVVSAVGTIILQAPVPGEDAELAGYYGQETFSLLKKLGLTDVFHAPWFHALLVLLAVNVTCATVLRFSLRADKLGFLLAHAGVVLVLLGGLVYFLWGDKGVIVLREGDRISTSEYWSKRTGRGETGGFSVRLAAFEVDYCASEMVLVGPDNEVMSVIPRVGDEVTLPWDDTRVAVERLLKDARRVTEVVPGPPGPLNPAASFRIETQDDNVELWRFLLRSGPEDTLLESDGRLAVLFDVEDTARNNPVPVTPLLIVTNHVARTSAVLPARPGTKFRLPGTTDGAGELEILEVLDDADNTTLGPGLRVALAGGRTHEWRHVFARLPGFSPEEFAGRESSFPQIDLVYYRPKTVLQVVQLPGATYELRAWSAGPSPAVAGTTAREGGKWTTRPMEMGQPVKADGVTLRLMRVLPVARIETRYEEAGAPTGVDAALLSVTMSSGERREFWVSTAAHERTAWLTESLGVGYFASRSVRECRSDVVFDENTDRQTRRTVSLNHPVWYHGWQFFQETPFREEGTTNVPLTVSRDPGLGLVYAGLVMLTIGVFFACFVKPLIVRSKSPLPTGEETMQPTPP